MTLDSVPRHEQFDSPASSRRRKGVFNFSEVYTISQMKETLESTDTEELDRNLSVEEISNSTNHGLKCTLLRFSLQKTSNLLKSLTAPQSKTGSEPTYTTDDFIENICTSTGQSLKFQTLKNSLMKKLKSLTLQAGKSDPKQPSTPQSSEESNLNPTKVPKTPHAEEDSETDDALKKNLENTPPSEEKKISKFPYGSELHRFFKSAAKDGTSIKSSRSRQPLRPTSPQADEVSKTHDASSGTVEEINKSPLPSEDQSQTFKYPKGAFMKKFRSRTFSPKMSNKISSNPQPVSQLYTEEAQEVTTNQSMQFTMSQTERNKTDHKVEEIREDTLTSTEESLKFKSPQGAILKKLKYRTFRVGNIVNSFPYCHPYNLPTFRQAEKVPHDLPVRELPPGTPFNPSTMQPKTPDSETRFPSTSQHVDREAQTSEQQIQQTSASRSVPPSTQGHTQKDMSDKQDLEPAFNTRVSYMSSKDNPRKTHRDIPKKALRKKDPQLNSSSVSSYNSTFLYPPIQRPCMPASETRFLSPVVHKEPSVLQTLLTTPGARHVRTPAQGQTQENMSRRRTSRVVAPHNIVHPSTAQPRRPAPITRFPPTSQITQGDFKMQQMPPIYGYRPVQTPVQGQTQGDFSGWQSSSTIVKHSNIVNYYSIGPPGRPDSETWFPPTSQTVKGDSGMQRTILTDTAKQVQTSAQGQTQGDISGRQSSSTAGPLNNEIYYPSIAQPRRLASATWFPPTSQIVQGNFGMQQTPLTSDVRQLQTPARGQTQDIFCRQSSCAAAPHDNIVYYPSIVQPGGPASATWFPPTSQIFQGDSGMQHMVLPYGARQVQTSAHHQMQRDISGKQSSSTVGPPNNNAYNRSVVNPERPSTVMWFPTASQSIQRDSGMKEALHTYGVRQMQTPAQDQTQGDMSNRQSSKVVGPCTNMGANLPITQPRMLSSETTFPPPSQLDEEDSGMQKTPLTHDARQAQTPAPGQTEGGVYDGQNSSADDRKSTVSDPSVRKLGGSTDEFRIPLNSHIVQGQIETCTQQMLPNFGNSYEQTSQEGYSPRDMSNRPGSRTDGQCDSIFRPTIVRLTRSVDENVIPLSFQTAQGDIQSDTHQMPQQCQIGNPAYETRILPASQIIQGEVQSITQQTIPTCEARLSSPSVQDHKQEIPSERQALRLPLNRSLPNTTLPDIPKTKLHNRQEKKSTSDPTISRQSTPTEMQHSFSNLHPESSVKNIRNTESKPEKVQSGIQKILSNADSRCVRPPTPGQTQKETLDVQEVGPNLGKNKNNMRESSQDNLKEMNFISSRKKSTEKGVEIKIIKEVPWKTGKKIIPTAKKNKSQTSCQAELTKSKNRTNNAGTSTQSYPSLQPGNAYEAMEVLIKKFLNEPSPLKASTMPEIESDKPCQIVQAAENQFSSSSSLSLLNQSASVEKNVENARPSVIESAESTSYDFDQYKWRDPTLEAATSVNCSTSASPYNPLEFLANVAISLDDQSSSKASTTSHIEKEESSQIADEVTEKPHKPTDESSALKISKSIYSSKSHHPVASSTSQQAPEETSRQEEFCTSTLSDDPVMDEINIISEKFGALSLGTIFKRPLRAIFPFYQDQSLARNDAQRKVPRLGSSINDQCTIPAFNPSTTQPRIPAYETRISHASPVQAEVQSSTQQMLPTYGARFGIPSAQDLTQKDISDRQESETTFNTKASSISSQNVQEISYNEQEMRPISHPTRIRVSSESASTKEQSQSEKRTSDFSPRSSKSSYGSPRLAHFKPQKLTANFDKGGKSNDSEAPKSESLHDSARASGTIGSRMGHPKPPFVRSHSTSSIYYEIPQPQRLYRRSEMKATHKPKPANISSEDVP